MNATATPAPSQPSQPAQRDLQIKFLGALLAFEADEVSLANATLIRDSTEPMLLAMNEGLNASLPFEIEGMEDITPLNLAAQSLSGLAHHMHKITGKAEGGVPTFAESQSQMAAADALRQIVVKTLDSAKVLRTTANPAGDAMQSLDALCGVGDGELIERCIGANLPLTPEFVQRMDLDTIHQTLRLDGAFKGAFMALVANPVTSTAMESAVNRAGALALCNGTTLGQMDPALKQLITPVTIDAALHLCVNGHRIDKDTVKGLLDLGANPLGASALDPAAPSLLWTALKDSDGVEAAKLLVPLTPNLNESHNRQSLLARAAILRSDELNVQLASSGAKFLSKDEAVFALVEAAEQKLHKTIDIALAQGANVNDIESSGVERTALICAGLFDDGVAVKLLLERGADPGLVVTKSKMIRGEGYHRIQTHFFDEVVRIDAVNALHAAAEHLGTPAIASLKASPNSPFCEMLLSSVEATGQLPSLKALFPGQFVLLDALDAVNQSSLNGAQGALGGLNVEGDIGQIDMNQAAQDALNAVTPGAGTLLGTLQKNGTKIMQVGPGGGTIRL